MPVLNYLNSNRPLQEVIADFLFLTHLLLIFSDDSFSLPVRGKHGSSLLKNAYQNDEIPYFSVTNIKLESDHSTETMAEYKFDVSYAELRKFSFIY